MNWWAIGGLLCIIYTLAVGGLALKKSPGLLKIVKMKLGKNMTDEKARTVTLVFAAVHWGRRNSVFHTGSIFVILKLFEGTGNFRFLFCIYVRFFGFYNIYLKNIPQFHKISPH